MSCDLDPTQHSFLNLHEEKGLRDAYLERGGDEVSQGERLGAYRV